MDSNQLDVVSLALKQIGHSSDAAAKCFLVRLAQVDPALSSVFGGAGTLACARLRLLARAAEVGEDAAVLRKLARRWRPFPIGYRDYATVGAVMLWTLREVMGAGFTLKARDAWLSFYRRVVLLLRSAARTDLQHAA